MNEQKVNDSGIDVNVNEEKQNAQEKGAGGISEPGVIERLLETQVKILKGYKSAMKDSGSEDEDLPGLKRIPKYGKMEHFLATAMRIMPGAGSRLRQAAVALSQNRAGTTDLKLIVHSRPDLNVLPDAGLMLFAALMSNLIKKANNASKKSLAKEGVDPKTLFKIAKSQQKLLNDITSALITMVNIDPQRRSDILGNTISMINIDKVASGAVSLAEQISM